MTYRLPSPDVAEIMDAPPTPFAIQSPDGSRLLLADYDPYPPVEQLARPFLRLGGVRVDPARGCRQRILDITALSVVTIADGAVTSIRLPDGARIGAPVWSFDGMLIAFALDQPDRVELWVADARTGTARSLGARLCDVLASPAEQDAPLTMMGVAPAPFVWSGDNRFLLARLVPDGRAGAPTTSPGPRIEETSGKTSQMATFQDLLTNTHDEDLFDHFATSQLAWMDSAGGAVTKVGEPGLIASARISPGGRHLLVTQLRRPFSYRVPYVYFSRSVQVWDASGSRVATVADLPVSDEVPRQGVPLGPRSVMWEQSRDATLLWAEALDGGDPTVKVPHRDRLMELGEPFAGAAREALRLSQRFSGCAFMDTPGVILVNEHDRDRRWRTTSLVELDRPDDRRVLFDLSVNDVYNDPGSPRQHTSLDGRRTVLQDGGAIYLLGQGATERGYRPFLDRYDLETARAQRLHACADGAYEHVVGFAGDVRDEVVVRRESPSEPPNWQVLNVATGRRRPLTSLADPHPHITGVSKQILRYRRDDGVQLSGTLYLPPDHTPGRRVPVVIWAYPMDYQDPATAGQVRGSDATFTRLQGASELWFLTRGYAVLQNATMPVVGDPETMNDTFVEQIVASAKAAIDTLDEMGVADRSRAIVGGHSYGAFMTANLLAHSELFAAGIARSGAYNRSLTPFGFQTERRSYWEVPEVYRRVSPFSYADRIKAPILLIHGAEDNNSGTFTVQSERLYQAIQGLGGSAKLVVLPHESHGYRGRESVLHCLAEMLEWAERFAPVQIAERERATIA
jgi:dipeptidyl aminopeptidase/acylaminoacyl peptidase